VNPSALVGGLTALVGVGVYLYLGTRLLGRPVSPTSRLANQQFAVFWLGFAFVTAIGGVEDLIAVATLPSLALVVTATYLEILLLCVVLWCLLSYLVFLFTARQFVAPMAIFYGILYVGLLYLISASRPIGVTLTQGTVALSYTTSYSLPLVVVLVAGLLVPELAAAFVYFTLVFRTTDRTVRYRITLVSWSLIATFGLGLLDVASALGGGLAAQLLAHSIPVVAAVVILLAYFPPESFRRRWGIRSTDFASPKAADAPSPP
jgi:hypothetical protein